MTIHTKMKKLEVQCQCNELTIAQKEYLNHLWEDKMWDEAQREVDEQNKRAINW